MGLLLIENHLGEPLHIDRVGTGEKWDLPAKQGDMPGRLLLDLSPGQHDFNDNTARGYGHIGVTITLAAPLFRPFGTTTAPKNWCTPWRYRTVAAERNGNPCCNWQRECRHVRTQPAWIA